MIRSFGSGDHKVVVLWPDPPGDDPIGEPAIVIKAYSDTLCIEQKDQCVNVNIYAVPDLLRAIREAMKP